MYPTGLEQWVMYVRLEKPEDDPGNNLGYETSEKPQKSGENLSKIPKEYHNFTVFRHKIKDKLPKRTAFDYKI